jgi:hypothetical protein
MSRLARWITIASTALTGLLCLTNAPFASSPGHAAAYLVIGAMNTSLAVIIFVRPPPNRARPDDVTVNREP